MGAAGRESRVGWTRMRSTPQGESSRIADRGQATARDPRYYTRFGFSGARRHELENEYHADEEFMVTELRTGALGAAAGLVKYRPEFNEAEC